MAGFQVSMYGRFWVSTEETSALYVVPLDRKLSSQIAARNAK
jgi:hypothetical protein